jgi:hypothetical protein
MSVFLAHCETTFRLDSAVPPATQFAAEDKQPQPGQAQELSHILAEADCEEAAAIRAAVEPRPRRRTHVGATVSGLASAGHRPVRFHWSMIALSGQRFVGPAKSSETRGSSHSRRICNTSMPLDHVIFLRRQSPDWAGLAHDYEAGMPIDPSRYIPRSIVPGFPDDIAACIRIWNETFPVNFFRCRQILGEISEHSLRQVSNARIIPQDRIGEIPAIIGETRSLVFFLDDDDLFAPDTFELLSALDLGQCDIAVFPLVRFGEDTFTFVRSDETARLVVGRRRNFGHRFQTNNYGIASRIARSGHLEHLRDHVLGSVYADQEHLVDTYFDTLISATSKTPCSANIIGGLPSDQSKYRAFISRYVENLKQLRIPPELAWMTEPLNQTIRLFNKI